MPPVPSRLVASRFAGLLLAGAVALGCGASGSAKRAQALYDGGDYAGAAALADRELSARPDDEDLWQVRIRAALAQADAAAVADGYGRYRAARGEDGDDAELIDDLATVTLVQGLDSRSVDVRVAAIETVEEIMISSLADNVAEQMKHDDDRVAAAASIAVLRGYPGAAHIASDLLTSEDPEARRIVTLGIGHKVGEIAASDLVKMARDRDATVRAAAITVLAPLADEAARAAVTRAAKDRDGNVRAAALNGIARDRRRPAPELLALAGSALDDRYLGVRLAAVELVAAAKDGDQLRRLAGSTDAMVAVRAATLLDDPDSDVVQQAITRGLAADDASIRAGAVNSMGAALGTKSAATLAHAQRMVADPSPVVRLAAARALLHAGQRDAAIAAFGAALDGTGPDAVQAAADLAGLDDPRGLPRLSAAVMDRRTTADARATAARLHVTAHRVSPGLVAALADPDGLVRIVAARALLELTRD